MGKGVVVVGIGMGIVVAIVAYILVYGGFTV
jgi:hypothetical protein